MTDMLDEASAFLRRVVDVGGSGRVQVEGGVVSVSTSAPLGVAVAPVPPVSASPADVLGLGFGPGFAPFSLQTALPGDPEPLFVSLDELLDGWSAPGVFEVTPDGQRVRLSQRTDAATTSGSSFARTEFREEARDGTKAAWDALKGSHRMWGVTRIVHAADAYPAVVIAQLHNGDRDRMALRTQVFSDGSTRLVLRINGTVTGIPMIANPYPRDVDVAWELAVVNGVPEATVAFPGTAWGYRHNEPLVSTGSPSWYWKAGCYNQANAMTAPNDYFAVEMSRPLSVAHE